MHLFAPDGAELLLHVLIKLKFDVDPGMVGLRRISTVSTLGAVHATIEDARMGDRDSLQS